MAKHIRLDNGDAVGVTSKTGTVANTVYGNTSAAYRIDLRSFLMQNDNLRYTSSNSEFHFGNDKTGRNDTTIAVKANACAYGSGASGYDCTNSSKVGILGNPDSYEVDVYFTPSANVNGERSTTIYIYDGATVRDTITLTANSIQAFHFSASAVVNNAEYGSASASVASATVGSTTSSASTTATFTATPKTGCQFIGWFDNSSYTGDPVSTNKTYTPTLTNTTAGSTESLTLYAKFVNKFSKEISWSQTINDTVRSAVLTMTGSVPAGESITYTASPAGLVSIDGSTVTCLKAGEVTITASSGETTAYFAAEDVEKTFTIYEHAITTTPTASGTLTYEQTLNTISPTGGVVNVEGTWAWKYPDSVPGAGTANQIAVFTPTSSVIDTVPRECNVSVTVNKATPDVTCTIQNNYMVDADAIDLHSLWTTESDGAITYSVKSFTPASAVNDAAVATPAVTSNRYLAFGKAGSATIQMSIAEGSNYSARTVTKDITIHKYNSTFTGIANLNAMVDEDVSSEYVLTYEKPGDYPGAANHTAGTPAFGESTSFYYTLSHDVQTDVTDGSDAPGSVIAYVPSTRTATGKNKGVCKVNLYQPETYKYAAAKDSFNVTVNKHEPVFTWNTPARTFYYKSDLAHIFRSTNTEVPVTSVSSNPNVATVGASDSTLHIYNVDEDDCKITMTQIENYKWTRMEGTYSVVPVNNTNKLPFNTWSQAEVSRFAYATVDDDNSWWWTSSWGYGNYVELDGDDPKSFTLHFEGIPDSLFYKFACTSGGSGNTWYVIQGPTLETLNDTIRTENRNNTSWSEVRHLGLAPTTRYVKFVYTGTKAATYQDIRITALADKFDASVSTLDFGLEGQNYGEQVMTLSFDHVNAGRLTNVKIIGADASKYGVSPTTIPNTGREQFGSTTLRVTFDNGNTERGENEPYNAQLVFYDNNGHTDTVNLTGRRNGNSYPRFTWNPNHMPYYLNTTISVPVVSNNKETDLVVTSLTPDSATIVNGKLVLGSKKGTARIRVYQAASEHFRELADTFEIKVHARPSLEVPFMMNTRIYYGGCVTPLGTDRCGWQDDKCMRIGGGFWQASDYWHDEKRVVIEFANVPDKLSMQVKQDGAAIYCRWRVEESSDGENWTEIWYKDQECDEWTQFSNIQISPNAHYLRFSYGGNYKGYFKNISISALDGYKYMKNGDKYLSRGGAWGTRAIVDEFGVPVRVTRYAPDTMNTTFYTNVQFMDSREYLYEAGSNTIYTDNVGGSSSQINWIQTVNGDTVTVKNTAGTKYVTVEDGKLKLTETAASATKWVVEDYTLHDALINAKLDADAAAATLHDFGAEVNTMAKVRTKLRQEEFDSTIIALPTIAAREVTGVYRSETKADSICEMVIDTLKPGFYCLTVQALYRPAKSPYDWENHANGMEGIPAYVYANDFRFPVKSVYDETGKHGVRVSGDTLCGGAYYPADLASADAAFSSPNKYWHDLYVYVEADEDSETGTLRFGVVNPSYVPGSWLAYKNFTLTRIGRKEYVFTGGAGTAVWGTASNWKYQGETATVAPNEKSSVVIESDVEVAGEFAVYSVKIKDGAKMTIDPDGGLTIGKGGLKDATAANFTLKAATSGPNKGKTGYLRISPEVAAEDMPELSMELYSIGYYDRRNNEDNVAAWQYVGCPIDCTEKFAKNIFKKSWVYSYDEATDSWFNELKTLKMEPFVGYATTQTSNAGGLTVLYEGKLIPSNTLYTVDLAYTDAAHGHNMVANSFAAPIDITQFRDTDFVNAEKTIYIFNTGSRSQAETFEGSYGASAGQFTAISIGTVEEMSSFFGSNPGIASTIAPMQGFCVNATGAGAKLKFDYNKLVWNANYATHQPQAMRAPRRAKAVADENEQPITAAMKISMETEGWSDEVYMLESERYAFEYEDGYDAHKLESGNFNVFTVRDGEQLAIDATPDFEGTQIGVRTGDATAYTLHFSNLYGERYWTLVDTEADQTIDINEGTMYTFFMEPNNVNVGRFYLIEREENAPTVTTGVEPTSDSSLKGRAKKFIKDNQLYILKNGVLYDATGARVR